MLPNLTTEQLSEVLPLIANLQQNEYTSVRELTYDVFIWIYENCRLAPFAEFSYYQNLQFSKLD